MKSTRSHSRVYFAYNQFLVYDKSLKISACDWTAKHSAQGFARRESTVAFNALLEFGWAEVTVHRNLFEPLRDYERVIAVPFRVSSGQVGVDGPEAREDRSFEIPSGDYRLVAAQCRTGEEDQIVDLFFEPLIEPIFKSEILIQDDELSPGDPLLETAGIPGEDPPN